MYHFSPYYQIPPFSLTHIKFIHSLIYCYMINCLPIVTLILHKLLHPHTFRLFLTALQISSSLEQIMTTTKASDLHRNFSHSHSESFWKLMRCSLNVPWITSILKKLKNNNLYMQNMCSTLTKTTLGKVYYLYTKYIFCK